MILNLLLPLILEKLDTTVAVRVLFLPQPVCRKGVKASFLLADVTVKA